MSHHFSSVSLPPWLVLDDMLKSWLLEDIGRGDRVTSHLFTSENHQTSAKWIVKEAGVIAGLPIASRVFYLLDNNINFTQKVNEGTFCEPGEIIAEIHGNFDALLTGERVALNLAMRLSGIATATRKYVEKIADLSTQLVDTRKTTPGLRILEKYASFIGGARNHRMGLDDGAMIKDNHISIAGGIGNAIGLIRDKIPYPLSIEVETETLKQVEEALQHQVDIIMLDNMPLETMRDAVQKIRHHNFHIKIEASGNITLDTIRDVAETGVDYISTSAPITRSTWLDLSMKMGNG